MQRANRLGRLFRGILVCALLISNFSLFVSRAKADAGEDLIHTLKNLTCVVQGIGDLTRSEFAHTCVSTSFFDAAIQTIITGGNYVNAVLRLKIRDNDLFPESGCDRENRIDPSDLKISYAMCSDSMLAKRGIELAAEASVKITINAFKGEDLLSGVSKIEPEDYHIERANKRIGFSENFIDVAGASFIPLEVRRDRDMMCVATKTLWGSLINVGCQYIAEPYPTSVHGGFFCKENTDSQNMSTDTSITSCQQKSCYCRSYSNSKTLLPMTGAVAECVREMSNRLLVAGDGCVASDSRSLESLANSSSFLFSFQINMQTAVTILLSIYVVISGLMIILKGDLPAKPEMINMVLKIVLVTYFSVGINSSDGMRFDGISGIVMPFLLSGIGELASWIINASPSELCNFDSSLYESGYEHLALWDSVDCRISHYLGLDAIGSMYSENQGILDDGVSGIIDNLSFPLPPYMYFLPIALYTGNISLVMLVLAYPLMVISVIAYLVNIFAASIISITILAFLAPIFVPFYLFNYTKKYFNQWAKLLFSFMLQPMMVTAFMIAFFSVLDFGLYGKCQYKSQSFDFAGRDGIRYFYVNDNWNDYDSTKDAQACEKSLGYILNQRLLGAVTDLAGAKHVVKGVTELAEGSNFGEMMEKRSGAFFNSFKVVFSLVRDFMLALITSIFLLYLMKSLSEQLSEFVADMVEGVPLSSVAIRPMSLYDGANALAKKVASLKSGGAGGLAGALSGDKAAGGTARSTDLASGGVARSSDMAGPGEARSGDSFAASAAGDLGNAAVPEQPASSDNLSSDAGPASPSSSETPISGNKSGNEKKQQRPKPSYDDGLIKKPLETSGSQQSSNDQEIRSQDMMPTTTPESSRDPKASSSEDIQQSSDTVQENIEQPDDQGSSQRKGIDDSLVDTEESKKDRGNED